MIASLHRTGLLVLALLALAGLSLPAAAEAVEPGVHAHIMWGSVDAAERDRQLDALQRAGAKVVRVDVGWASLQPDGPGAYAKYHVDRLDAVVEGAAARGMRVLVTLIEPPCWASLAPEALKQGCAGKWWDRGVQKYGTSDNGAYANAAAWVAARYGARLAGLEIENEPNHPDFFKGDDRAGRYAALVRATYPVVKAASPGTTVIAGALSESDVDFQNALYDRGIAGHYDAFSIHPYSHNAASSDVRSGFNARVSFARGVPAVRAAQLARGDRAPLWLTEYGWSTSTLRGAAWASGVDEAVQARYLEDHAEALRRLDYVAVSIYYNLKDTGGSDQASMVGNYGLLREDGSEKQGFAAFRRASAILTSAAPAPQAAPAPAAPVAAVPGSVPAEEPLVVRVAHQTGALVVTGTAPATATTVTVRLHRKVAGRKTLKKASYRVKLKPKGRKKAFRRKLPKRLASRSWKVVATARVPRRRTALRAETSAAPAPAVRGLLR